MRVKICKTAAPTLTHPARAVDPRFSQSDFISVFCLSLAQERPRWQRIRDVRGELPQPHLRCIRLILGLPTESQSNARDGLTL